MNAPQRKTLTEIIIGVAVILVGAFTASVFAPFGWAFDLASHFVIQYLIAACVLGPALYLIARKKLALIVLLVGLGSAAELALYHHRYYQPSPPLAANDQTFSVVQYNRLVAHTEHAQVISWLRDNPHDVVVLQEASHSLSEAVKSLKDTYPYQLHKPRPHAFGMIILSRQPFLSAATRKVSDTVAFQFTVEKYKGLPVTIYALHAFVPVSRARDEQLLMTASLIAEDTAQRIIFMGDWNITPFSPVFDKILKATRLQHRDTSLYPVTTWPSFFIWPPFQIPIDQILFSPGLVLQSKQRGPHMNSDHYPLIATFTLH